MKEKRFKFKLHWINVHKNYNEFALLFHFDFHPVILKEKYATQTESGHWRMELGDWLRVYFLWWNIDIYFNNKYWQDICHQRNKEK